MNEGNQAKSESSAVSNFREYLRIKTVQPNPDYDAAISFLKRQADELELPIQVVKISPRLQLAVITLEGTDPTLPSLLLSSHMDVVPVFVDQWMYDPFEAVKDDNGNIYARGSQDMKCIGIQYMEAVRLLKEKGKRFKRTIHMLFTPDEEIGSDGIRLFIGTPEFKKLNVGFALDEGYANPTDKFTLFYGERCIWWVKVSCCGSPGHGSQFIEDHAAGKLQKVMNYFLGLREQEKKRLSENGLTLGDVTTVNMTILEGGVQPNVLPAVMSAVFDIRIPPTVDLKEFEQMIERWCSDAGNGVSYEFLHKTMCQTTTSTDTSDPWWQAFKKACDKMEVVLEKEIFPAATDSRFLRQAGYPALGFSPMNKTPILLHDHNEFLNEDIFLRGIEIYCEIISSLADVPAF